MDQGADCRLLPRRRRHGSDHALAGGDVPRLWAVPDPARRCAWGGDDASDTRLRPRLTTMDGFDIDDLDEVIHGRVRLGLMAFLSGAEAADFATLKARLQLTDGNLSVHLK